jgi:hypothetical protein
MIQLCIYALAIFLSFALTGPSFSKAAPSPSPEIKIIDLSCSKHEAELPSLNNKILVIRKFHGTIHLKGRSSAQKATFSTEIPREIEEKLDASSKKDFFNIVHEDNKIILQPKYKIVHSKNPVKVSINIPQNTPLKIEGGKGITEIKNIHAGGSIRRKGWVKMDKVLGNLTLELMGSTSIKLAKGYSDRLKVNVRNGSANILLPRDSNVRFELSAEHGSANNSCLGLSKFLGDCKLGTGKGLIKARAQHGSINVAFTRHPGL